MCARVGVVDDGMWRIGNRRWLRAAAILFLLTAGLSSSPLSGQTCQGLPVGSNEVWIGGGIISNGTVLQPGALVSGNVAGVLGMEWGVTVRRYQDGQHSPTTLRARIFPGLGLGSIRLCPFLQWQGLRRSVSFDLRIDHGELQETQIMGGLAAGGELLSLGQTVLGWQTQSGVMYRDWDLEGRRTLVDEAVEVEEIHWIRRNYHLTARGGLWARRGDMGVMAGLGTRPHHERDFFGYLTVGFRLGS